METYLRQGLYFLATMAIVTRIDAFHSGAPCSSQFTMSPSAIFHGVPQNSQARPPPYRFEILDINNQPAKNYREGLYKIRLTGATPFRGFLIQVRPATKEGYPIGHLRVGEFVPDLTWSSQGVQVQPCPSTHNDSITHTNNGEKTTLEVMWRPAKNYGPVLFVLTVVQNRSTFWTQWLPSGGFLLPDESGFKLTNQHTGDKHEEAITRKVPPPVLKQQEQGIPQSTMESMIVSQGFEVLLPTPSRSTGETTAGVIHLSKITPEITFKVLPTVPQQEFSSAPTVTVQPETTAGFSSTTVPTTQSTSPSTSSRQSDPVTVSSRPVVPFTDTTSSTTASTSSRQSDPETVSSRSVVPFTDTTPSTTSSTTASTSSSQGQLSSLAASITTAFPNTESSSSSTTSDFGLGNRIITATVNPNVIEAENILKNTSEINYCSDFPCFNNGTCKNVPVEDRFQCLCTFRWTGKRCEIENFCGNNKCINGECVNGDDGYKCKCRNEWAGEFCERHCPSYLCHNGGTCILTDGGKEYGCACAPGWTGERCRHEIDHCQTQPCKHGGTCTRKFNGFQCQCPVGYMGSTCHRPCQDIYGSCTLWNEEQRCESMRPSTKFFDVNCAVTCKQCAFDNHTLLADVPLPPALEEFDFLLGRWTLNASTYQRFPLDFGSNSTFGYREEITFAAVPVPMFGTPSINYSAIATSNRDPSDMHINAGFMTLKPSTKPLKVSLMSTGNEGITVIEEGFLNGTELSLSTQYLAILPKVDSRAPALVKRVFSITNQYLRESVERLGNNGQKDYFTKYYFKEEKFLAF